MKWIPKLIIWLTKLESKKIATVCGNEPKQIYPHRNNKGEVIGLLFKNVDEPFTNLVITKSKNS